MFKGSVADPKLFYSDPEPINGSFLQGTVIQDSGLVPTQKVVLDLEPFRILVRILFGSILNLFMVINLFKREDL